MSPITLEQNAEPASAAWKKNRKNGTVNGEDTMKRIREMTTDPGGLTTTIGGVMTDTKKKDNRSRREDNKDRRGFSYKSSTSDNANKYV